MLDLFKEGDFQTYRDELVDLWVNNKSFDADFSSWLTTVESTGCTVDATRPPSPVEPVNIDDIQGDDQVGINACALGRLPEDRNIKAGSAICLTDTSNANQVQLGLSVPSGLENVSLEITLRHGNGNADLLHRWNNRPNTTEYDNISNDTGNNETITITPVVAGWNYIHVRAADEFSNVTLLARYIQNEQTVADNVLEKGVSKVASGNKGEDVHFIMNVPEGASALKFDTNSGSGDADMYVKFGSAPTTSDYDCRPYKGGNVEHCDISNIEAGTYYVMLHGYNNFTDVNVVGNFEMQDDTGSGGGSGTDSGLQNDVNELVSGVAASETIYSMTVPAGASNLIFSTSGGTGDVDMHVKFGNEATTTDYDCRPWKVGSNETCNISNVQAGTYYIMLLGYSDFTDVELVGKYTPTP
jgi:microbial collagenase